MTTFTPHQNQALSAVADWLKAKPGKKDSKVAVAKRPSGKAKSSRELKVALDSKKR